MPVGEYSKTGESPTPFPRKQRLKAVELFSGAGGLALGIGKAGFQHEAVIERDKHACDTVRENQAQGHKLVRDWTLYPDDVTKFDFARLRSDVDLVAGGPPCQPFSIGGKHRGHRDNRDMFPQVIRAVRALRPRAILVENVRGLLRKSFASYFGYIMLQLEHPEIARRDAERWADHLARLEKQHTSGTEDGLRYQVVYRLVNAANYGVPQKRDRVFLVGFRSDLKANWSFPEETRSLDALLHEQWVTGGYWERNRVAARQRPDIPARVRRRVEKLRQSLFAPSEEPWRTVNEALADLPDPESEPTSHYLNHSLIPGARTYKGHTGSPLHEPAKTLKAGDHGVPGGENTLLTPDGRVRYFTVRESARLQTFPDDYVFHGSWSETMRQLGNAVPVDLSFVMAGAVGQRLAALP